MHKKCILAALALGMIVACSKTPEERGKELAEKKIGLVKGIAEGLKAQGKQTGEALGEGVTKTIKGVATGVDVAMALDVRLDAALQPTGLKATNAEPFSAPRPVQGVDEKTDTTANGVSVYLVASTATDSRLLLRAHNKQNQEIGRSLAKAQIPAGSAAYVDFAFDDRVKLTEAEYYTLAKAP